MIACPTKLQMLLLLLLLLVVVVEVHMMLLLLVVMGMMHVRGCCSCFRKHGHHLLGKRCSNHPHSHSRREAREARKTCSRYGMTYRHTSSYRRSCLDGRKSLQGTQGNGAHGLTTITTVVVSDCRRRTSTKVHVLRSIRAEERTGDASRSRWIRGRRVGG